MGSGDLVTNRATGLAADLSTDGSVERLTPAASAPALQGHTPAAEVGRKARRSQRSDEDAELEASPEQSDEPKHRIDSLA